MVNVPFPLHPVVLVNAQLPVILLLATLPVRVSVFPLGVAETIIIVNVPVTDPLKLPVSANDPVSVPAVPKHESFSVVNVRFVTLTPVPLVCVKVVVKAKAGPLLLFGSVKVAVQFPLMFPELLEPPPQALTISARNRTNRVPTLFIADPPNSIVSISR
jgi:hypothetical protein